MTPPLGGTWPCLRVATTTELGCEGEGAASRSRPRLGKTVGKRSEGDRLGHNGVAPPGWSTLEGPGGATLRCDARGGVIRLERGPPRPREPVARSREVETEPHHHERRVHELLHALLDELLERHA